MSNVGNLFFMYKRRFIAVDLHWRGYRLRGHSLPAGPGSTAGLGKLPLHPFFRGFSILNPRKAQAETPLQGHRKRPGRPGLCSICGAVRLFWLCLQLLHSLQPCPARSSPATLIPSRRSLRSRGARLRQARAALRIASASANALSTVTTRVRVRKSS